MQYCGAHTSVRQIRFSLTGYRFHFFQLLEFAGNHEMKIVFLQLPVPRYAAEPVHENDPLAAGYLIGYFLKLAENSFRFFINTGNRNLTDYGGDKAIV